MVNLVPLQKPFNFRFFILSFKNSQKTVAAEHMPVNRAAKSMNPSVFLSISRVGLKKLNCSSLFYLQQLTVR